MTINWTDPNPQEVDGTTTRTESNRDDCLDAERSGEYAALPVRW